MTPLEDALRQLPKLEGQGDWTDLESRLARLRPTRQARPRRKARVLALAFASLCLLAAGSYLAWAWGESGTTLAWERAHEDAAATDPWADPWVAAAVETDR